MAAKLKPVARVLLALIMIGAGALHFIKPQGYVPMVSFLPFPLFLVYASGVAEIVLGALLLPQRTRRFAGLGLIALYIAVFPANLYMLAGDVEFFGEVMPRARAIARLPFQLVFIALAWWVSKPDRATSSTSSTSPTARA